MESQSWLTQVEWLKAGGVTDVVFLVGYLWQEVEKYVGDGRDWGVRAHYSVEDNPLGRGGAIKKGFSLVPTDVESVLVLNGDIVTGEKPATVLGEYQQRAAQDASHLGTIMVVPMVSPYGLVDTDDQGTVTGFREKVTTPYWINAGIYVFSRRIESALPSLGDHETSAFPRLAEARAISAFKSRAFWRSVDSFKDLREAEEFLERAR